MGVEAEQGIYSPVIPADLTRSRNASSVRDTVFSACNGLIRKRPMAGVFQAIRLTNFTDTLSFSIRSRSLGRDHDADIRKTPHHML